MRREGYEKNDDEKGEDANGGWLEGRRGRGDGRAEEDEDEGRTQKEGHRERQAGSQAGHTRLTHAHRDTHTLAHTHAPSAPPCARHRGRGKSKVRHTDAETQTGSSAAHPRHHTTRPPSLSRCWSLPASAACRPLCLAELHSSLWRQRHLCPPTPVA